MAHAPHLPRAPGAALLAGGSGLVGRELAALWPGPGTLHLLLRRPLKAGRHQQVHLVDFQHLPPLPPAQDAFCCLGTTLKTAGSPAAFRAVDLDAVLVFARAAQAAGVQRMAVVSHEDPLLGAADGVTGSRHLVELAGSRILLDCGLFQGFKVHRERNWAPPPELLERRRGGAEPRPPGPQRLPAGTGQARLPRRHLRQSRHLRPGPVLLMDSAHLQEEDARRANRYGYSRHEKALPLYTKADAQRALARFKPLPPGREQKVGRLGVTLTPAGHLLGACSVHLSSGGSAAGVQRRPGPPERPADAAARSPCRGPTC
jgi:hypothetical protein